MWQLQFWAENLDRELDYANVWLLAIEDDSHRQLQAGRQDISLAVG